MHDVSEGVSELGEEMEDWELGGGTGMGVSMASITGLSGMEVTIS